ncbi:MAG: UDP-2,3-diacylglucosamine diphosphatase [Gammaproteobacteria bacterium]|nr:UDP-2,3-diacylglucosamine diphosphatase [Gammaproteobacteria bacterium]
MDDEYLFISDCHLDDSRPQVTRELINFLDVRAATARCLYILGDLFEVWLGDDNPVLEFRPVVSSLQRLARKTDIFFMAGNRDFLLGQAFAQEAGINLLEEPHILQLDTSRVVLIHGDTLCTDDHDYQAFRSMVRSQKWQADFLSRPLSERQQIATQLRSDSANAMSRKTLEIMDVNPRAVQDCFLQNEIDTIVHGHTHRPAIHQYEANRRRIVLGNWTPEPSYLSWKRDQGFGLNDLRI